MSVQMFCGCLKCFWTSTSRFQRCYRLVVPEKVLFMALSVLEFKLDLCL